MEADFPEIILIVSLLFQIAAAVLAFRLISLTGRRASWISISAAIFLIALRRGLVLYEHLFTKSVHQLGLPEELLIFATSVFFFIGLLGIEPYFRSIRQSEEASKENFQKAFRANPAMLSISRIDDGRFIEANDAYIRTIGYSREELIGHSSIELGIWEPEKRAEMIGKLLEHGRLSNEEIMFSKRSGGKHEGLLSAEIIEIGGAKYMLSIVRDVSEQRKAEREKAKLQQEQIETLKQADRLKNEFLSVISHELRTPLNAIMGFGSILEDECPGPLNEQQHDYVQKILKGSDRMLRLVEDLLDFARMQAGTFIVCLEETDFSCLVEEALASFEPQAEDKKIAIEAEIAVSRLVRIDRHRIFQVLANLLSNALKFTQPGGKISVKAFLKDEALIVEVRDNGIGIKAEDLATVFEPFKQLDMSLTRRAGGVGLGLSISKVIAEAHGGTLVAESPGSGMGSVFRLVIPGAAAGGNLRSG